MNSPIFEISPTGHNGKRAFQVTVINSLSNPELHAECERLGLKPTADISNHRSIIVTTQTELDAVRNSLRRFFKPEQEGDAA